MDIREFRGYRSGFHPYNQEKNYATRAFNLWQASGEFSPMCDNAAVDYGFDALPGVQSIQIVRRNDGSYSTIQIPDISLAEGVAVEDIRENVFFNDQVVSLQNTYTDDITYTSTFNISSAQPPEQVRARFTGLVTPPEPGTRIADTTFVVTYLTADGHESAPSLASGIASYDYNDEADVTVQVPIGSPIVALRVYMSVAGELRLIEETTNVTTQGVGLGGNLVATTANFWVLATNTFDINPNDTTIVLEEGSAPPLNPLHNMINISGGRIAGVSMDNRSVYISDPGNPISFPFRIPMANRVVRIIRSGEDVLVLTDGRPTVITGYESPYEQELDFNEPCISADSVVDMGFAILYLSYSGICSIERYSGRVLTMDNRFDGNVEIIDQKEWRTLPLSTAKATSFQGRYLFYYTDGNGNWNGSAFNTQYGELIDMPLLTGNDIFFVKNPDPSIGMEGLDIYSQLGTALRVERFQAGTTQIVGKWIRDFEVVESEPFVYARVEAEDYTGCSLTVDGRTVPVTNDRHFTVKSSNRKRIVRIIVESSRNIQSVKVGHAVEELY